MQCIKKSEMTTFGAYWVNILAKAELNFEME